MTTSAVMLLIAVATGVAVPDQSVHVLSIDPPVLRLTSAFSGRGGPDPARRAVMAHALLLQSHELDAARVRGFAYLAWVTLFDRGLDGRGLTTSLPGNLVLGARRGFRFGARSQWSFDAGLAWAADLTSRTLGRPMAKVAYAHALAIFGGWDSWLWAQGHTTVFFPIRLAHEGSRLGRWAQIELEATGAVSRGKVEVGGESGHPIFQVGASHRWWIRPPLSLAVLARSVVFTKASSFRNQTTAGVEVAVALGTWRLGGQWLANLDEPYGYLGTGQRVSALTLEVAWRP